MITDVELSRAVNALSTTLRDQRPGDLDARRAQEIVDGSLGGERKLRVRADAPGRGAVLKADDGSHVASIERRDGQWVVTRDVDASGSDWAQPS